MKQTVLHLVVLILIVVEYGLGAGETFNGKLVERVLILIVVEYGLGANVFIRFSSIFLKCLNPYCSGIWSRSNYDRVMLRLTTPMS